MLENATIEDFKPHVGTTFTVLLPDGAALPMVLSEVSASPTDSDPRRTRAPFNLIFRPPNGHSLRQGTYRVEGQAGTMEIFLVPILPDREGARIQVVFS
jgi:hypothetical protein